jgi:hypothetical protein
LAESQLHCGSKNGLPFCEQDTAFLKRIVIWNSDKVYAGIGLESLAVFLSTR